MLISRHTLSTWDAAFLANVLARLPRSIPCPVNAEHPTEKNVSLTHLRQETRDGGRADGHGHGVSFVLGVGSGIRRVPIPPKVVTGAHVFTQQSQIDSCPDPAFNTCRGRRRHWCEKKEGFLVASSEDACLQNNLPAHNILGETTVTGLLNTELGRRYITARAIRYSTKARIAVKIVKNVIAPS